jgi:putative protease
MEKLIGKVNHYFDKAMVMVVMLEDSIAVGDKIKVKRGEEEFEQEIESMQIEHEQIEKAKKGEEVAIKISEATKEGAEVYKVE